MSVAVGLDVGTSGLKALAVSEDGEVVGRAELEYGLSTPQPGWAEQDPEDWWRAASDALEQLGADDVAGIGLSGQMHGLVALDADEQVLRPAILWNDQRTGAECEEIEARIGLEKLIAATGNRALTGFTAPKLLWLEKHEPEVHERIAHILLPKDYVRLKLTGERAIDVADASGTLLFDVAHRKWSDEVCAALGVPSEWLPRALESAGGVGGDERRDPGRRRRGRPGRGRARRRRDARGRAAVGRARHVRRRVRALPRVRRRPRGARPRVLPRGAGDLARDGRDAQRRGRAALAARRDRRRRLPHARRRGGASGSRASRA